MNKILAKIICLSLALLCVLPAFTGCGSREKAVKTKLTNVFRGEEYDMPADIEYINNMTYSGGRIFASTNKGESKDDGSWVNTFIVFSMNPDGTDYKEIFTASDDNMNIGNILFTPSGNIWMVKSIYSYNEETGESNNQNFLVNINTNGELLSEVNLTDALSEIENPYFNGLSCDSQGRLYSSMDTKVLMLNADASLAGIIDFGTNYVNNVFVDRSDNVYASYYDQTSGDQVITKLDTAAMSTGTKIEAPTLKRNSYSLIPAAADSSYDFYFNDTNGISGYSIATDTATEVCNWIASDINGNNINSFCVVDDETIVTMSYNYDKENGTSNNSLSLLKHIPDDQIVEKYILTLACVYCDYNVREAILDFNKQSDEYKITIKDYSTIAVDDDYDNIITALNNDIVAGNIPDLIQLNTNMPIQSYISKGLFADLYKFIDEDETINRDDYLTNILQAFETNGKLYELVPSFSVQTVAGKKSIIGDISGWNMDEFNAVIAANPDAIPFNDMTQDQLLQYMCTYTADQFVDRETGVCSFDGDGFKKVLEFAKDLSTESMWENFNWEDVDDDFWEQMETACRDGRVLLEIEYLSSFRSYWQIMKGTFGEDISLVGFPTDTKNGSAISPSLELAMSAKTPMPEGAWQFLRYFLTDEYQDTITYEFPIKVSRLNALAESDMKPQTYTDYLGNTVIGDSSFYIGGEEIKIGEITQEYVDILKNFIKSLTMVYRYDTDMIDIIKEEAAAYFAGSKDLDETVKIIQNRVSIYINEGR